MEEAQRQLAEAHETFQRAMTDSHLAYLRMAEATMAGLLGGAPVPVAPPPPPPPSPPPPPQPPSPSPEIAVPTAPQGPTAPEDPTGEVAASVEDVLLAVVADRTGFPVEILNVDMALDTDLGIDSIKRVEILSAVRDRIGDVPAGDLSTLATLRTLREIADRFGAAPGTSSPAVPEPEAVPRRTRVPVPAARSGLAMPGLYAGRLAVTEDGRGIAALVVAGLARHGIEAQVVDRVPADAAGVILLDGLRTVESVAAAVEAQRDALRAARAVAARMESSGGVFVTVQDTGGDFGLATPAEPHRAWLGGLAALARTAAREWPRASVKAIDCGGTAEGVAAAVVAELLGGAGAPEVGLRADGTRVVPVLRDAPVVGTGARIGPHSVVVATGGARGVTAAGLLALAREHRPRLVLLGRTPLSTEPADLAAAADEAALIRVLARETPAAPAELAERAREVLAAREVRDTLAALERDGVPVRYLAVDVRDGAALGRALDEVRRDWGPVTAVVHGAGVIADARLTDKTDEQFDLVFGTKVAGLAALLAATAGDPLDVLCAFSSVAAVFGNPGQADYAMANEVLAHVLAAERARRPGCLVRAIAWGPWDGGMVTPELAERFRDGGTPLIDRSAGGRAFAAELAGPADPVLAILGDGPAAGPDLVAEIQVNGRDYPYLADHRVGGVAVVPVATVLDWFARAAAAWHPGGTGTVIRDLRVLDKVALPRLANGGHRLVLHGDHGNGALDLHLTDDTGRPHYRASVVGPAPSTVDNWAPPPDLAPVPQPYEGTALFHGPALRAVVGTPSVGAAGAHGVVAAARALGWSGAAGEVDVAAVDGALQLAVLWARGAGAGDTLPMAVGEIRLHRRVDGATRCVVRAGRADDTGAVCDAALVDDSGVPHVELVGIHLVRRPGG